MAEYRPIKERRIEFRLSDHDLEDWRNYCREHNLTLAALIRRSVEYYITTRFLEKASKPLKKGDELRDKPEFTKVKTCYKCNLCGRTGIKPQQKRFHKCEIST
jgi:hypothetical protein